MTYGKL